MMGHAGSISAVTQKGACWRLRCMLREGPPLTVGHLQAGDHPRADRQAVAADGIPQHSHRLLQG
jgi:hypothetical protein